jgi:hypothetical protein
MNLLNLLNTQFEKNSVLFYHKNDLAKSSEKKTNEMSESRFDKWDWRSASGVSDSMNRAVLVSSKFESEIDYFCSGINSGRKCVKFFWELLFNEREPR